MFLDLQSVTDGGQQVSEAAHRADPTAKEATEQEGKGIDGQDYNEVDAVRLQGKAAGEECHHKGFCARIYLDEESGQQEEADELNNPPDEVDFFELPYFSFQFIFCFLIHGIIPSFSAF